jgi:hypothetical protein
MVRGGIVVSLVLCLLGTGSAARGQATRPVDWALSFPLQGYYRPGRFMPVRLSTATTQPAQPAEVEVRGGQVIPTHIRRNGGDLNDVYPLLSYGSISELSLFVGNKTINLDASLHPLPDAQRLIGYTIQQAEALKAAKVLFGNDPVTAVPLDPANPLPGATVMWEALDAVVLDPQALARVSDLQSVVSSGISIIVVQGATDAPPEKTLPWQRIGESWVLRSELTGPRGIIVPAVYSSMSHWAPGRTRHVRQQVLVRALLLSILVMGLILWRANWAPATVGVLVAIFLFAAGVWMNGFGDLVCGIGRIAIARPGPAGRLVQWDTWTCATALRDAHSGTGGRLVFASIAQLQRRQPRVNCTPGAGQWMETTYALQAGEMIAMCSRSMSSPGGILPEITSTEVRSPLLPLVKARYLDEGERRVVGQSDADPDLEWIQRGNEWWETIVIDEPRP